MVGVARIELATPAMSKTRSYARLRATSPLVYAVPSGWSVLVAPFYRFSVHVNKERCDAQSLRQMDDGAVLRTNRGSMAAFDPLQTLARSVTIHR
jgi:hypothetical protein